MSWVELDPTAPATLTFLGPEGEVVVQGELRPGPSVGLVYEARLPALRPGDDASYDLGGREFDLRLPPEEGALRVVFLGDMGITREAGAAVETLQALAPHLVLHAGDISYAEGDPLVWEAWFDLVEPIAASVPWVPAIGNHEAAVLGASTDEASAPEPREQAFYRQRFPQPAETFWHSFDLGGVHFVALDTFSEATMPPEQLAWLEADLAAAKDASWIVAYLHEPPYSSNAAHGSSPRAHDAFAAILEEAGVDLVVTGHDHSYERTHVLRDGKVVSTAEETLRGEGTRYVVTGGGGASLYTEFVEPQPEWSAARAALHHVFVLDVTEDRLDARVVPTTGDAFADAFAILATRAVEPAPRIATPFPFALVLFGTLALALARRARP